MKTTNLLLNLNHTFDNCTPTFEPLSIYTLNATDEKLKDDLIELRTNHVLEMQFESKTLETLEQFLVLGNGHVSKTL